VRRAKSVLILQLLSGRPSNFLFVYWLRPVVDGRLELFLLEAGMASDVPFSCWSISIP